MRPFLRDAFASFGATVDDTDDVLAVTFPEDGEGAEFAKAFGRSELNLVFESRALEPGRDLVIPGSHVLRALEAFLATRGRRSYVVRPGKERLTLKTVRTALKAPRGYELSLENRRAVPGFSVYVVYRLHYRSMERVDTIESVRVDLFPGHDPTAELEEVPSSAKGWVTKPRKQAPEALLEEALAVADRRVRQRAREEGKAVRERVRKRFSKDVGRLHAYYAGQIAEYRRRRTSDLTQLRLEELDDERELRIKELVAATEVTVEIEPLQLLTVEVPGQAADVVLRPKEDTAEEGAIAPTLAVQFDRANGILHTPTCVACAGGFNGTVVDGCASGHLVHEECLSSCDRCGASRCDACDAEPCGTCQAQLCAGCASTCPACEASACADHLASCEECGLKACQSCLHTCVGCNTQRCAEHLQEGPNGSFCRACATPCPGCKSPAAKASLTRCDACGRRFCADCAPKGDAACVLCR